MEDGGNRLHGDDLSRPLSGEPQCAISSSDSPFDAQHENFA